MGKESDYVTNYSLRPAWTAVGEDNVSFPCVASTSTRSHVHVRFSFCIIQRWADSDEEDQMGSRTICLSNDILEEPKECRDFILSEGLFYWPIDADTVVAIAQTVTEKAQLLRCNLLVDICSVNTQTSNIQERSLMYEDQEDDQDSGAAAPGVIAEDQEDDQDSSNIQERWLLYEDQEDDEDCGAAAPGVIAEDQEDDQDSSNIQELWYLLYEDQEDDQDSSNIQERWLLYEDQEDDQYSSNIQERWLLYEDQEDAQDFEATAPAIKSLKRKRIEYEDDGERGGYCVICLEELTVGAEVAVMPCKHYSFHDGCLSTWLERSRCCPLCRCS